MTQIVDIPTRCNVINYVHPSHSIPLASFLPGFSQTLTINTFPNPLPSPIRTANPTLLRQGALAARLVHMNTRATTLPRSQQRSIHRFECTTSRTNLSLPPLRAFLFFLTCAATSEKSPVAPEDQRHHEISRLKAPALPIGRRERERVCHDK
jgi:hypothetical protein